MNREEYIAELEAKNGYSNCPKLQVLYQERRVIKGLEGKCDFLGKNVDLKSRRKEDAEFIIVYQKAAIELHEAFDRYRESLDEQIISANLVLRLHNASNFRLRNISVKDFLKSKKARNLIITAHCDNCDQQFEVVCR